MWIRNIWKRNGWIKLNKEFLKALCDVIFVIFISSLFDSFITLGKKEFIKHSALQLKDGKFVLFLVAEKRVTSGIRGKDTLVFLDGKFYGRPTVLHPSPISEIF